jgi:hypothetical protein
LMTITVITSAARSTHFRASRARTPPNGNQSAEAKQGAEEL